MPTIGKMIESQLQGDESRVLELFCTDSILNDLEGDGWHFFEPNTFDGFYLVRTTNGYACYEQDCGAKTDPRSFDNFHDAAAYYFTKAGYIKPPQNQRRKWWQIWQGSRYD